MLEQRKLQWPVLRDNIFKYNTGTADRSKYAYLKGFMVNDIGFGG